LAGASLGSAQFNMGRVVGPALAGVAVATAGYGAAFAANAGSFLAVAVAVAFIRLPPVALSPSIEGRPGLWATIADGLRALRTQPGCRAAVGLIAVVALLASPFIALIPAVARLLSSGSPRAVASATAALTTAQGVGAVVGALVLAPLALRFGRGRLLVTDLCLVCGALMAYALMPTLVLAVIALAGVGAIYIGVLSGLSTVVQLQAPPEYRGRLLAVYFVALGVLYPIGSLVQGPIADAVGLRTTSVAAAALLLAVLAWIGVRRPHVYAALEA
jgi:hypothetical protein